MTKFNPGLNDSNEKEVVVKKVGEEVGHDAR
jgi:hypothetical protein